MKQDKFITFAPKIQPSAWKPGAWMTAICTVQVADIVADPFYQMRSETDAEVSDRYAAIMKENDPEGWAHFPRIRVFSTGKEGTAEDYRIISGFHRFEAIMKNGYDEIQVELMSGDETDALIASLGQNTDRSLPRTQSDIQAMIEFCLTRPEISEWSNRQIANWCRVDHKTVNNHELRMVSTGNFPIDRPDKLKYLDKHGNVSLRTRKLPTPKQPTIGDGLAIDPKGEVVPSTEPQMDADGLARDRLIRDITYEYNEKVRDFIFHTDPAVMETREADLIDIYPIIARYPHIATMALEGLRDFKGQLEAVTIDLSHRRVGAGEEMSALLDREIWALFPKGLTYVQADEVKKAIGEAFPQLQGSLYELSYYDRHRIISAIPAVAAELKATGIDAYLPESYGNLVLEEENRLNILAKSVYYLRQDVWNLIKTNVYKGIEIEPKEEIARGIFLSQFNKAHPADQLKMKRALHNRWDLDELSDQELVEIKAYWQKVQKAVASTPSPRWMDDCVHKFKCQRSALKFIASRDYNTVGKAMNLIPDSPLTGEESLEIVRAAHAAAKEKADEIHRSKAKKIA